MIQNTANTNTNTTKTEDNKNTNNDTNNSNEITQPPLKVVKLESKDQVPTVTPAPAPAATTTTTTISFQTFSKENTFDKTNLSTTTVNTQSFQAGPPPQPPHLPLSMTSKTTKTSTSSSSSIQKSSSSSSSAASSSTTTSATTTATTKKRCKCKNSRCIKLYCECFTSGTYCIDCDCVDCHNNEAHKQEVEEAIAHAKIKKPEAFIVKGAPTQQTNKGCKCKNTNCKKNYCECFRAGVLCGEHCKCTNCKNCDSSKTNCNTSAIQGSTTAGMFSNMSINSKQPLPQTLLTTPVSLTTTSTTSTSSTTTTKVTPVPIIPVVSTTTSSTTASSSSSSSVTTVLAAAAAITVAGNITTGTTASSTTKTPINSNSVKKESKTPPLSGINPQTNLSRVESMPSTGKKRGRPPMNRVSLPALTTPSGGGGSSSSSSISSSSGGGGEMQMSSNKSNSNSNSSSDYGLSPIHNKTGDSSTMVSQSTTLKSMRRITLNSGEDSLEKMERKTYIDEALSDEAIKMVTRKLLGHLSSSEVIADSRNNVSIPKHVDSKINKIILFYYIYLFLDDDISSTTEYDLILETIEFLKNVLNKAPNKQ